MSSECLIFANYFCGWWRELPNKWNVGGQDWRLTYPERIPKLGCFNDSETMDAEIAVAAEYGVDCFMMLWYPNELGLAESAHLNECIPQFMCSANRGKMRFMLEYCNHAPFLMVDDGMWQRNADFFVQCMKHSSYQRVDGKALFKIHGLKFFFEECGRDMDRAVGRLDYLRKRAREQGVGELLLTAGVMAGGLDEEEERVYPLFDYLSTYADVPALPKRARNYSYLHLKEQMTAAWEYYEKRGLNYVPYVMSGWNPKPWHDARPSFNLPTRAQWRDVLETVKRKLNASQSLGIPTEHGVQKAFNIYAWNEFGEGGMLAPTLGDDCMKLEELRNVFSVKGE